MKIKFLMTAAVVSLCSTMAYASDDSQAEMDSPESIRMFSFEEETPLGIPIASVKSQKKETLVDKQQKHKPSDPELAAHQLGIDPKALTQMNKALLEYIDKGTIFGAPTTDYQAICLIKIVTGFFPSGVNVEYYRHMQSVKPNSLLCEN